MASHCGERETRRRKAAACVGAGLAVGSLIGLVDFGRTLVALSPHLPPATTLARALGLCVGMHALPGALLGALVALFPMLGVRTPRLSAGLTAIALPSRWLTPSPALFTGAVVGSLTLSGGVVAVHQVSWQITSTFHDVRLATWAVAISATTIVLALSTLLRATTPFVDRLALRLGPAASPLALAIVAGVVAGLLFRWVEVRYAPVLRTFDTFRTIVFLATPLMFSTLVIRFARREAERVRDGIVLWISIAAACVAFAATAMTYGNHQAVRSVLEDNARISPMTLALLQRVLDLDGDGHARLFGGRDCNDADAAIGPGMVDVHGDGIDRDCFGGDGTPSFDDTAPMEPTAPPSGPPPNVVLITVDALRADRVRNLTRGRTLTPRIDAFLDQAVHYTSVTSASPRTIRSVPAMMTGRYPGEIAFSANFTWPALLESNETLAERLAQTHRSLAVIGTSYFARSDGFFQGFDIVQSATTLKPPRGETLTRALGHITPNPTRPVFLWVHLFNVHEPYLHDRAVSLYGPGNEAAYDTEVTHADEEFGEIIDQIERVGWSNNTVVILASDHGEGLGAHQGLRGHSTRVFEDQIASVLAIRAPGVRARRVDIPVALFDVFPTVIELTGRSRHDRLSSRTLVPSMRGDLSTIKDRYIFSEVFPDSVFGIEYLSVRRNEHKLIFEPRGGRFSLYDLAHDPDEQRNIADDEPTTARRLLSTLRSWESSTRRPENRTATLTAAARVSALPSGLSHPFGHVFDDAIELLGADFDSLQVTRGGYLEFDLFFRKTRWTNTDFAIAVRFMSVRGGPVVSDFHAVHAPVDGRYPTSEWRLNEIVRDHVRVRVPTEVPPSSEFVVNLEIWGPGRQATPYVAGATLGRTLELVRIRVE